MAITPINGISVKQNYRNNNINFAGKRRMVDNDEEPQESNLPRRSSKMATVPVIVLMAMTPGMMEGKQPVTVLPANAINIEAPANLNKAEKAGTTYYMAGVNQSEDSEVPDVLSDDKIQHKETFVANGKKYTMYYTDLLKGFKGRYKDVSDIYIVPQDFKLIKDDIGYEANTPPKMIQFRYHKISDDINNNFVGAVLHQKICDENGNNTKFKTWEIRLPDEIANKILYLILGETELTPTKGLVKQYVHVTTPNLMPTKIEDPIQQND